MAYLRDAKYIKTIAESNHLLQVSDEACRAILCISEAMLRNVIIHSIAVTKRFRKKNIQAAFVELAIKDMNLDFLINGCTSKEEDKYIRSEEATWELDPTEITIQSAMQNIIENKLKIRKPMVIHCDWIAFSGKVFQNRYSHSEIKETARPVIEAPAKPAYEPTKNGYVIKEITPNVLSEEANDFYKTLVNIIEDYFIQIDREQLQINFQKWSYTLSILRSHPRLQVVLPFVLHYIIRSIETPLINGFEKKSLFLDIIEAFFNNPKIEVEFHLHLVIYFLTRSLLSATIAVNVTDSQAHFRQKSALLLSRVLSRFAYKFRHKVPDAQTRHYELTQRIYFRNV